MLLELRRIESFAEGKYKAYLSTEAKMKIGLSCSAPVGKCVFMQCIPSHILITLCAHRV